jgi:hypothetical protein
LGWRAKYSEENLSECYFVHHKSHMTWDPVPDDAEYGAVGGMRIGKES